MLRKLRNLVYLDFKSHYPSTIITRNISKSTLFGRLKEIRINDSDKILWTTDRTWTESSVFKKHLGEICLAIANKDIVSYGAQVCNLPTFDTISEMLIPYDSKPLTSPNPVPKISNVPVPTKYRKFTSVLSKINQLVFTKTDEEASNKDNKMFMFTNGQCSYLGSLVTYNYKGLNLIDACGYSDYDKNQWYYGIVFKQELVSVNEKCNIPKFPAYDIGDAEWQVVPNQFLFDYGSLKYFSRLFVINYKQYDVKLLLGPKTLYYPIDYFLKLNSDKPPKGKNPILSDLLFRCVVLDKTYVCEFKFTLSLEDIELEIVQQAQFIKLNDVECEADPDFYSKLIEYSLEEEDMSDDEEDIENEEENEEYD